VTTHGLWEVSGRRVYRGHKPGELFEASLPQAASARAVQRGDIRLLEEFVPCVPEDHRLPEGWAE